MEDYSWALLRTIQMRIYLNMGTVFLHHGSVFWGFISSLRGSMIPPISVQFQPCSLSMASMLCHATGFVWWDFCDRMTMVTVAYMSLILVMEEAVTARRVTLGCTDFGKEDPLWLRILRALGYCVIFSAIWFVYVLTLEGCDTGHCPLIPGLTEAVGFGAPIVVILGLVCLERFLWRDAIRASNANVRKAWRMVIAGSIISIIATIIWVFTEQTCDTVVFFRWFPGHVFLAPTDAIRNSANYAIRCVHSCPCLQLSL